MTGPAISSGARATAAASTLATCAEIDHQHAIVIMPHPSLVPAGPFDGITDLLTGLRHFTRHHFSIDQALGDAGKQYAHEVQSGAGTRSAWRQGPRAEAGRKAVALHAAAIHSTAISPLPPEIAEQRIARLAAALNLSFGRAAARIATDLMTDLQHYATRQGISFGQAAETSRTACLAQRIAAGTPFDPGTDTLRTAALPLPDPGQPFPAVPTHLGVISTDCDAQWLLIRTEALIRELHWHGADPASIAGVTEDTRLLATALGTARGLTGPAVLSQLRPAIDARRWELLHGPEAAAALGRSHGISGVPAYALNHAGEEPPYITTAGGRDDLPWARTAPGDRPLMQAFGETEHTTPLNAGHRSQLIQQYSTAYYRARKHAGAVPARTASLSFPADPHHFLPSLDPAALIRQAAPQPAAQPGRPLSGL